MSQPWWSWRSEEEEFGTGLAALRAWMDAHGGELPPPWARSAAEGEGEASWVGAVRRGRARGRLKAEHTAALEQVPADHSHQPCALTAAQQLGGGYLPVRMR
jgi:hypothetical protein